MKEHLNVELAYVGGYGPARESAATTSRWAGVCRCWRSRPTDASGLRGQRSSRSVSPCAVAPGADALCVRGLCRLVTGAQSQLPAPAGHTARRRLDVNSENTRRLLNWAVLCRGQASGTFYALREKEPLFASHRKRWPGRDEHTGHVRPASAPGRHAARHHRELREDASVPVLPAHCPRNFSGFAATPESRASQNLIYAHGR